MCQKVTAWLKTIECPVDILRHFLDSAVRNVKRLCERRLRRVLKGAGSHVHDKTKAVTESIKHRVTEIRSG